MLSENDVRYVARLARIAVTDDEVQNLSHDLNRVLDYITQLQKVNTQDIEPTMHVIPVTSPLRDDVVEPSLTVEVAMKNGPHVVDNMFVVPRIVEKKGASAS